MSFTHGVTPATTGARRRHRQRFFDFLPTVVPGGFAAGAGANPVYSVNFRILIDLGQRVGDISKSLSIKLTHRLDKSKSEKYTLYDL